MAIEKAKNKVGLSRYPSPQKRTKKIRFGPTKGPNPFDPYGSLTEVDLEKEQLNKIKRVVTTSRIKMNTLHEAHHQALNSLSLRKREILEEKGPSSPEFVNLLMPSIIKTTRKLEARSATPKSTIEEED